LALFKNPLGKNTTDGVVYWTPPQHIWRQKLYCRRATSLEQPPSTLARRSAAYPVKAVPADV